MRCRIKEVIISCHMVLIKPSLKCYALFIKNKEIKKNWGKRVRMILEPVTFGGIEQWGGHRPWSWSLVISIAGCDWIL